MAGCPFYDRYVAPVVKLSVIALALAGLVITTLYASRKDDR